MRVTYCGDKTLIYVHVLDIPIVESFYLFRGKKTLKERVWKSYQSGEKRNVVY